MTKKSASPAPGAGAQNTKPVRTQLQDLARKFAKTIFHQEHLIKLAKTAASNQGEVEGLMISIDRFNDDLFELSQELEKIANDAAKEAGND